MIDSIYSLRNEILGALNETYCRVPPSSNDWYLCKTMAAKGDFTVDINMSITVDILALLAYAHLFDDARAETYRRDVVRQITNLIWFAHPGGTTAEYAANVIADLIGVKNEA